MTNTTLDIATDYSGIGAFEEALKRLGIPHNTIFACEMDKFARQTYIANHATENDKKLYNERPTIITDHNTYSFDFPANVYHRKIPKKPLDIYVTTPPCQAFSMSGKRQGEDDKRGILFYNSHEFIDKNRPRFFIFENVKGLLSDDGGKTFQRWIDYLGGKTVNPVIFPHDKSVPYHIYYKVLNAKHYNVPQNRERVFIIGIRDDADNNFNWPKPTHLTKRLKDVLETFETSHYKTQSQFDKYIEKYFLSDKAEKFITKPMRIKKKYTQINGEIALTATAKAQNNWTGDFIAQTLDTACNQGVMVATTSRTEEGKRMRKKALSNGKYHTPFQAKQLTFKESDVMNTITCATSKDNLIIGAIRGRKPHHQKHYDQEFEANTENISNTISTVQKDNVVMLGYTRDNKGNVTKRNPLNHANTIHTATGSGGNTDQFVKQNTSSIRRLTPRECARLMDFSDSFIMPCSDSQMYKQFGNSVVVEMFVQLLTKLLN